MKTISQPLKWHGGKTYQAAHIIGLMPPRCKNPNAPAPDDTGWLHYVDAFFGGGAVLLAQDPEGISEVVNDKNKRLTNFWATLRCQLAFPLFKQLCEATPIGSEEWREAHNRESGDPILSPPDPYAAHNFFIRYRQSRQGLGKCFTTLVRNRTRRGMQEQVSAWLSAVEGLPEAHERLKRVVILNDDAIKVIKQQDGTRTLFYLDPPYLHETRAKSATDAYEHEMTESQHEELLYTLLAIQGRFLLSGYPSRLYDLYAQQGKWRCETLQIDNKSSSAKSKEKKTECVWMNY